jgi:hypothetical protein
MEKLFPLGVKDTTRSTLSVNIARNLLPKGDIFKEMTEIYIAKMIIMNYLDLNVTFVRM